MENYQYTLKDMKDHIVKNHLEVMNEIVSIRNKCYSCDNENKSKFKSHEVHKCGKYSVIKELFNSI